MVAITFPEELATAIQQLKEDAANAFESYKALNSPPHLTLISPFNFSIQQQLVHVLSQFKFLKQAIPIKLLNFNHFGTRTIYIDTEKNNALHTLQTNLEEYVISKLVINRPVNNIHTFKPHVTILNRDLTPENYEKAWKQFRKTHYQAQCTIQSFSLLKHQGVWEEITRFNL